MSELQRIARALTILGNYDKKNRSYIECHYENFIIPDIDPNDMTVVDRKEVIDNGMYLCSERDGEFFWSFLDEQEDFNPKIYNETLEVISGEDYEDENLDEDDEDSDNEGDFEN